MKDAITRIPKVTTQKLGLGETTDQGAYYAKVDGHPIGERGRAFWHTRDEAHAAGRRFAAKLSAYEESHG